MITRDSIMLSMYPSRLLSCPMYFWYRRGREATSKGVPTLEWYHSETIVWPSGLMDGHRIKMTFSRMARTSGSSSPVTKSYAS